MYCCHGNTCSEKSNCIPETAGVGNQLCNSARAICSNVFTSIPLFTDYSVYAASLFEMMGLQATLSDPEGARAWGFAAAVVVGLGWLLTAVLSWMSMRRGRISWWIPLVGALVFSFASGILLTVPLFQDPAVWDVLVSGASS